MAATATSPASPGVGPLPSAFASILATGSPYGVLPPHWLLQVGLHLLPILSKTLVLQVPQHLTGQPLVAGVV
eukprot:4434342-Prorocentrum_lima.AAC.1